MVEPISIVTESVISVFLQDALKRISEKLSKGRKLTEVETLTLLVTKRFNSVEQEMRSGFNAVDGRLHALETQYNTVHEVAELKAKVAQLEARA